MSEAPLTNPCPDCGVLVITADDRPITQADIDAAHRIMAELESGDICDATIRIPAASSDSS